ncbi:hypothetical protein [Verrucomicrobium spinosum]|uniref:hypothetical protein n=1 Tax=Verrucomicrobium spinosum TaxID=2736 RepID=UPI000A6C7F2C|nr:hypothetical protein [Verrucomicrobium spinosum]
MKSRLPLALLISLLASRARPPLKTVPKVVLPRFMGDWHVFAHIPYSLAQFRNSLSCRTSVLSHFLRARDVADTTDCLRAVACIRFVRPWLVWQLESRMR